MMKRRDAMKGKQKIQIMMIQPFDDGGISHYTYNLLNALTREKLGLFLLTSKNYEFSNESSPYVIYPRMFRLAALLIRIIPWLSIERKFPSLLRRTIKIFEYPIIVMESLFIGIKRKVDIIHFQTVNLTELIMILGFKCIGEKVVFTIHNVLPRHERLRFYHRILYQLMYSLCDQIIIHSRSGKDEIVELFGVNPAKISVIALGDQKFFLPKEPLTTEQAKEALAIPTNYKTVLFFGAIRPNKGLENLLLALPGIKRKIPEIKLLIIGEACENYERYREIIEKENIKENVFEKLDYIPNQAVAQYFSASDLVALPYNEVTQSAVLQIAYAFGRPVVATAIGGLRETIEDGKNGFLVPEKDIDQLAEKIIEILSNEDMMKKMGNHSRHLADTKYSWDSIAEKTLNVYQKLWDYHHDRKNK